MDMEENKLTKINMKNIFKITIEKDFKENPRWTERQKLWINKGFNLKSLFSKNLKTLSRIDDFRRKFLMRYWRKNSQKTICQLCGRNWHNDHLFKKCKVVEEWEDNVYGEKGRKGIISTNKKRDNRINAMMDDKSPDHTFSWIYNWCIWLTYWDFVFEKFEDNEELDKQTQHFIKLLKKFEKAHLLFASYSFTKNYTLDNVTLETQHFTFQNLKNVNFKNGNIDPVINEIRERKKNKKKKKKVDKKLTF
jgi:hypothetical protein